MVKMTIKEAKKLMLDIKNRIKDIPDEEFTTELQTDESNKCCVIGHYNRLTSENPDDYSLDNVVFSESRWTWEIWIASNMILKKLHQDIDEFTNIASINNRSIGVYNQETPKERVMAFLNDVEKMVIQ